MVSFGAAVLTSTVN